VYVYEAFVVVFSASLLGLLIGTMVGWTMVLQRVLFTQLPIPFPFPTIQFVAILVMSAVFALFALIPTKRVVTKPIVEVMRMTT
jgi:ABC-type antimicrobial peptide transport system permease subunit